MKATRKLGMMWRSFHNLCRKLLAGSAYRFSELPQPVCVRIPLVVKAALLLTHTRRHVPVPDNSDPVLHHSAPPTHPHDLLADDPQTNKDNRDKKTDRRTRQLKVTEGIKETKRASKHQSRIEVFDYLPVEHARKN